MRGLPNIYHFLATCFLKPIIHENEYWIMFIKKNLKYFDIAFSCAKFEIVSYSEPL